MRSMRPVCWICLVALCLAGRIVAPAAQSQPEFRDGLVFLSVRQMPVQDVLRIWQQRGGTQVIVRGPLPSEPVTLEFDGIPESSALASILASTPGYVARERFSVGPGQSLYAVLCVLGQRDLKDGGTAAHRAVADSLPQGAGAASSGRLVDFRDLPPQDPGNPNVPPSLTPANLGDAAPPPWGGSGENAEAATAAGRDPGVNPIPAGVAPPSPTPERSGFSAEEALVPRRQSPAAPPPVTGKPGEAPKPVKPPKGVTGGN